ncbi:hypothetical protein J2787_000804 [Chryseobacterium rhizosphaerae]|uniref:Uncharacterized protein n=1 Tax=Chryseobacterium rhizosphaerae TaxID=395937 RepID=A0AAE3Y7N1_9FLAO|nr:MULTISPECIES: hypothetical protein [Chryseobacterium]MBP1165263.1 hypothetical protein [Chryseobacterium sp. PvR013]MDR6525434.1 hypothetical protein [Chryseobacterium rhizosphaerae]
MKKFTSPDGVFEIDIPIEWDYRNEIMGLENSPPFSFEPFRNSIGCFQLSHYKKEKNKYQRFKNKHEYFENNLKFEKRQIDENDGFIIIIWATTVKDFFFMAKYVYQKIKVINNKLEKEIEKVENSLKSLICIEPNSRTLATHLYRYEKFVASLGATFDLKAKAIENESAIELLIINANQIDAYLRLSIVLKYQILDNTKLFRIKYLFQDQDDKPINEKNIYREAQEMKIIDINLYNKLFDLYNERNKIVHRYIITDIKTFTLYKIAFEYEKMTEKMRLILRKIETEQFTKKVGYHSIKNPHRNKEESHVRLLKSMINEKHFLDQFHRDLE